MTQTFFIPAVTSQYIFYSKFELEKINVWFIASRLSLNIKNTKYTLFRKKSVKDSILLKLPDLKIANNSIKRASIKCLREIIVTYKQSKKTLPI